MRYEDMTVGDLLDRVASRAVTPAGGTAAAVGGAIGTALCEMACLHTIGKDGYEDVEDEMIELREELRTRRDLLLDLADRDAAAVDDLFDASRGDADRTAATKRATGVPLAVAEACLPVLEGASVLAGTGNRNAVPDAVTGAFLVRAALDACVSTARSNLSRIPDRGFVEEVETRTAALERAAEAEFDRVTANAERDG
jgi:formiminotetrahydrofolate cyclodeaminase